MRINPKPGTLRRNRWAGCLRLSLAEHDGLPSAKFAVHRVADRGMRAADAGAVAPATHHRLGWSSGRDHLFESPLYYIAS